jgi:cytochrome o ubiquinol oxidase subunit 3
MSFFDEYIAHYFHTRARRLTGLLVVANAAFFAALLAVFVYTKWNSEDWPTPFHFPSMLMAVALSMFALCGSATVLVAEVAARKPADLEPARRWMAIAVTSWFLFLFLEIVEWVHLVFVERLGPSTQFGSTFLAVTGAHYVAGTCCLVWFGWAAAAIERRDLLAPALYSHFLNLWWIVIMITIYFPNSDLRGI